MGDKMNVQNCAKYFTRSLNTIYRNIAWRSDGFSHEGAVKCPRGKAINGICSRRDGRGINLESSDCCDGAKP